MKKLVIVNRPDLKVLSYGSGFEAGKGSYRAIVKCPAGFMVSSAIEAESPIAAFRRFKPKAIQSIAYITEHGDLTVFARNGKKIWASECFLRDVEVGDINQELYNTGLYSQSQYAAVNAKSWACKAYVMNEEKSLEKVA